MATAGAPVPELDGIKADMRAKLESLASHINGSVRLGRKTGQRIFVFPAWWLAERVVLNYLELGKGITKAQEFLVDDTGIRSLGLRGRELQSGGHNVLLLSTDDSDGDGHDGFREPPGGPRAGDPDTATSIAARAGEHWQEFVTAARGTRVFGAMRRIGRNDVRTALWLSRRGPRGEFRRLQFAENHPELAAQILPLPHEAGEWHAPRIRDGLVRITGNRPAKSVVDDSQAAN
ncbi:MAG: hypothetical protein OXQ89_07135 [Rhodospirillaceae bacterium]|nr:hypothetical protein [Rhodospirillaceae bacterium]